MKGARISVVIPNFERNELLDMTLASLRGQDLSADQFEVIVADDGSSADTLSVIKKYADAIDIKYFWHPNRGFRAAAARNAGIKLATSDICLFLDCGVILDSEALKLHVRAHDADSSAIILGYVHGFSNNRQPFSNAVLSLAREHKFDDFFRAGVNSIGGDYREELYRKHGDNLMGWPAPWVVFWTCHVSVTKPMVERVGMFDEYFDTWGGEDTELGIALFREGGKFVLNRNCRSFHYPHDKSSYVVMDKEEKRKRLRSKQEYIFSKHPIRSVEVWLEHEFDTLNSTLLDLSLAGTELTHENE